MCPPPTSEPLSLTTMSTEKTAVEVTKGPISAPSEWGEVSSHICWRKLSSLCHFLASRVILSIRSVPLPPHHFKTEIQVRPIFEDKDTKDLAFLLSDVLTEKECVYFIDETERIGSHFFLLSYSSFPFHFSFSSSSFPTDALFISLSSSHRKDTILSTSRKIIASAHAQF